jgi:hypothetical protein
MLTRTLPGQVAFEEERFEAWGNDAYESYSKNINHPEFAKLFASGLNYEVILRDLVIFDQSTREFKHHLKEMTGYDFAPHVKDFFSTAVESIVYDLCTEAIPEALRRLADDLTSSRRKLRCRSAKQITVLREIRRDPSFADRRGVIAFRRVGGKLELGAAPTSRSDEYRRQLDRAVTRIQSGSIISRIHNRDPELAILFAEYDQELSSNTPNSSAVRGCLETPGRGA